MLKKYDCTFFTATILEWKPLLADVEYKKIIIDSLGFLVKSERIYLYAFVIMDNHIHLLWHIRQPFNPADVQRDFLRFTGKMILKKLRSSDAYLLAQLYVGAKDRKYQVWERNALSIDIWNEAVLLQKLNYIHENPVRAGLCQDKSVYKHSSAAFYDTGIDTFGMLSHYHY